MVPILQNSNLDHIGIIVKDMKVAREKFSQLFGAPVYSENFISQKIFLDKYKLSNCVIEVFQPYPDNDNLQKFLSKKGEGIHHICVGCITSNQVQELKAYNWQLIYSDWQPGSNNSNINFVHPSGLCNVLLELKKK